MAAFSHLPRPFACCDHDNGRGSWFPAVPPSATGRQCLTRYRLLPTGTRLLRTSRGSDGSDEWTVGDGPVYLLTVRKAAAVSRSMPSPLTSGSNAQTFTASWVKRKAEEHVRNPPLLLSMVTPC